MAFRTFLGPLLLGTQKWGAGKNTGGVPAVQTKSITFNDGGSTSAMVLPAGALITDIKFYTNTAFTGTAPTITVTVGGVTVVSAQTPPAAIGLTDATVAATAAAVNAMTNVGTTDATVAYTWGGTVTAGAAVLMFKYVVREVDGSAGPAQG